MQTVPPGGYNAGCESKVRGTKVNHEPKRPKKPRVLDFVTVALEEDGWGNMKGCLTNMGPSQSKRGFEERCVTMPVIKSQMIFPVRLAWRKLGGEGAR